MIWTHNGQSGMSKQKSIALVRSRRLMGSDIIWSSMGNNLGKSFDIDIIEALTIIGKASHYSTHLDSSSVTNSERCQRTKTLVSLVNTCSSKKYFFILTEGFFHLRRELLSEVTPVASKYLIFYQCRVVCCQVNFSLSHGKVKGKGEFQLILLFWLNFRQFLILRRILRLAVFLLINFNVLVHLLLKN